MDLDRQREELAKQFQPLVKCRICGKTMESADAFFTGKFVDTMTGISF